MKIGTKSVMFGAHAFWFHPWLVALAWWKLYSFPFDPRLWAAFFLHDVGYWGKDNIDGKEGKTHPEVGANIMGTLFDRGADHYYKVLPIEAGTPMYTRLHFWERQYGNNDKGDALIVGYKPMAKWYDFCLYHSRWYANKDNQPVSKLCAADKLAFCLEPYWFYMMRVKLSGEYKEFFNSGSPVRDQYERFYKGNMKWVRESVDQQRA